MLVRPPRPLGVEIVTDVVDCKEVVLTEDLAPLLERVLSKRLQVWEANGGTALGGVGPITQLAEESGILERRIFGILHGEQVAIDLDIADRLLLACGMFVELELPDSIYRADEIRKATAEQTEMIWSFARQRGIAIPARGTSQRRQFGAQMRRLAHREKAA